MTADPVEGMADVATGDDTSEVEIDETGDDDDDQDGATGDAADAAVARVDSTLIIQAVSNLDSLYGLREIGREALCWRLSSAKPGNGVEQIRDQNTDTYWQSDGVTQPHLIQIHFARRVAISHVCLYLDYNLDESYTPKTIAVQCGMTTQDLVPAIADGATVELNEPVGWVIIPVTSLPDPLDDMGEEEEETNIPRRIVRAHLLQIEIRTMHQNGRDTHVRQVQLYGPRTAKASNMFQNDPNTDTSEAVKKRQMDDQFVTTALSQFSYIR
ncbi:anaphase-promoting complex, subunit 10 (APC10)-domain containing protein [Nitzschia inconspicua]|uniref:Anaphase-promoting complex, subunit 10 (APC10)-domain containing protein n=1 Tax=Nitzschia inconspicua TaxID=303405 RepID=A0A9K3M0H6_9STRA|nr:anaphase-promoting complex, subunit 10 (APC10)-domain containing protein [Nitzschia inconspicua]